jgi:hypothetical protein
MRKSEEGLFFEKLEKLSQAIHNGELKEKWSQLVQKEFLVRRRQLLSKTSRFHRLMSKLRIIEPFLSQRQIRLLLNLMRCEAHRDLSVEVLLKAKKNRQ